MIQNGLLPARKLVLFTGLSALDFVLTWSLLRDRSGRIYESNPLAEWWLSHYGWLGLATFKALVVLVFVGLVTAICVASPRLAKRVLTFACSALLVVVLYSCAVAAYLCSHEGHCCGTIPPPLLQQDLEWNAAIQQELDRNMSYLAVRDRLSESLVAGTCSLSQAAETLHLASDYERVLTNELRRRYLAHSDQQCLLLDLLRHLATSSACAKEALSRLEAEYQQLDPD